MNYRHRNKPPVSSNFPAAHRLVDFALRETEEFRDLKCCHELFKDAMQRQSSDKKTVSLESVVQALDTALQKDATQRTPAAARSQKPKAPPTFSIDLKHSARLL